MSTPGATAPTRRVGRAMAWGVAIGVGAVVFRELVRPREQSALLIDWGRVEQIALARSGEAGDPPADLSPDQTYQQNAAEIETPLTPGLGAGSPPPMGAFQYPDLSPNVRAPRGSPAADPGVPAPQLWAKEPDPLSRVDAGA